MFRPTHSVLALALFFVQLGIIGHIGSLFGYVFSTLAAVRFMGFDSLIFVCVSTGVFSLVWPVLPESAMGFAPFLYGIAQ